MTKDWWQEQREAEYKRGYRAALEDCMRDVREKLGDRLVNNTWQPGSPLETEIVGALEQRRPR